MTLDLTAVCARHGIVCVPVFDIWAAAAKTDAARKSYTGLTEADAVTALLKARYNICTAQLNSGWGADNGPSREGTPYVCTDWKQPSELTAVVALADRLQAGAA